MSNATAEKRRFFRIDDAINLSYQLIDENTAHAGIRSAIPNEYALAGTFDVLSQEASRIMQGLEKQNDPLLELYKVLDAKINALAQVVMFANTSVNLQECQDVNLSASGMAFKQSASLDVDQYLAIEMYLPSTLALIRVYGKVVKCEQLANGEYSVGVEYTDIKEEDQELLIKHVVRKQWQQLQEKRSQVESSNAKKS